MKSIQQLAQLTSLALTIAMTLGASSALGDANSPASFVYSPSEGNFSQFMVEDLYPTKGDHDFNDALVAIHQAVSLNSEGLALGVMVHMKVIASGARLSNNLALRLPISPANIVAYKNHANGVADIDAATTITAWGTESDATYTLVTDTNSEFSASNLVNTRASFATEDATEYRYTFNFTTPQTLNTALMPYDLFLFRDRGDGTYTEVHLTDYAGTSKAYDFTGKYDDGSTGSRHFVDTGGVPFALLLPTETAYPKEGESIDSLFPSIVTFGSSAGTSATDFYLSPQSSKRFSAPDGSTIPTGDFLGFSSGNEQCLPASDICDLEGARTSPWCIPSAAACDVSNPPVCGASCTPDLTLACPSECTGGCSAGVCTIDCTGKDGCKDDTIDCPDGLECFVNCKGDSACSGNTEINCPQTGEACRVDCHKKAACSGNTEIHNSAFGSLELLCKKEDACKDASVYCGTGSCMMTCQNNPGELDKFRDNNACQSYECP